MDRVVRLLKDILKKKSFTAELDSCEIQYMLSVLCDNNIRLREYITYCETLIFDYNNDDIDTIIRKIDVF